MARPLDSTRLRLVEPHPEPATPEQMLTTAEVCDMLKCSEGLVRKLRRMGKLNEVRLSERKLLYRMSDIQELLGTR